MPFASPKQKNKVCGNCTHINEPASDLPLLVNICREIASNGTSITALTQLAQHVRHVTGAKRWCRKEGWTHLLDEACYAWKPRKTEVKILSARTPQKPLLDPACISTVTHVKSECGDASAKPL